MTPFTDAAAAVSEASWLAQQDDKPYAVIRGDGCMHVVPYCHARFERLEILEVCGPVYFCVREDAA